MSQGLDSLVNVINEMLSEKNNQNEWKKGDVILGVLGKLTAKIEPPVVNAHVRCTCCTEETSEVYVYQKKINSILHANKGQLNHKDTVFKETFEGCINVEGGKCDIRILDDIWFAPDESIEVGDGYALNGDTSYMICLTGYGMIYISDSGQSIGSMEDKLEDKLLDNLINKEAFEAMGWSSELEVVYGYDIYDELKKYMKEYGIVNSVSIGMFLATMNVESEKGTKKLEDGGKKESEYFGKKVNYSGNVRGAGLIQISIGDQKEFLKYVAERLPENDPMKTTIEDYIKGYCDDDRDNTYRDSKDRTAAEFIADEFPVESAVWYWTAYNKVGTSAINDCVITHAQDNRYNTFAVTQMAVNGTPYAGYALDRFCTCQNNCVIQSDQGCTEPHTNNMTTGYCFTLTEDSGEKRHDYGPTGWTERLEAYEMAVQYINQIVPPQ